jgi:hypothetical protein
MALLKTLCWALIFIIRIVKYGLVKHGLVKYGLVKHGLV